ncbi:uncharacterized protein LOC126895344 [Daktulosphaira vitifoliae]|uniref:uncharacterized protein LOC126894229 n=1 Tax=Daktulosphaira vitifoliae TaxID=58002 RepID=UPI0021AAAF15|nr:uncharacterized protein LOC126894229 [Daktulosphaira vitifoliae]XP_050523065.1 uncharacterized protein LOC126895344 [Daktulosphaira vitifoliae]
MQVIHQIDRIVQYADGKWTGLRTQQSPNGEMYNLIRSMNDLTLNETIPKVDNSYLSELKNVACDEIVDRWVKSWSEDTYQINEKEEMYDENDGPSFFNETQENSYSSWASQ